LHERTFRRHFAEEFDWLCFNMTLTRLAPGADTLIGATDCTFLSKSCTETYGLDRFWSGAASQAEHRLEASAVSLTRTDTGKASAAGARQTPPGLAGGSADHSASGNARTRVDFYVEQLTGCLARWDEMIRYVAADGY